MKVKDYVSQNRITHIKSEYHFLEPGKEEEHIRGLTISATKDSKEVVTSFKDFINFSTKDIFLNHSKSCVVNGNFRYYINDSDYREITGVKIIKTSTMPDAEGCFPKYMYISISHCDSKVIRIYVTTLAGNNYEWIFEGDLIIKDSIGNVHYEVLNPCFCIVTTALSESVLIRPYPDFNNVELEATYYNDYPEGYESGYEFCVRVIPCQSYNQK